MLIQFYIVFICGVMGLLCEDMGFNIIQSS